MSLSEAERAALVARQQGLSHEVSSRTAALTQAQQDAAQSRKDAKLISEVARLEKERDLVVAKQNAASGTVADALAVMEAAAAALVSSDSSSEPAFVEPDEPDEPPAERIDFVDDLPEGASIGGSTVMSPVILGEPVGDEGGAQ